MYHEEERGGGKQAAVDLLGEREAEAAEAHQQRDRDHGDVPQARAILAEYAVAGSERKREKGDTRRCSKRWSR